MVRRPDCLHLVCTWREEESFGNSRWAPGSEVFSITRKLWVPNGRFFTSGRRKRRVKPASVESKIPDRSWLPYVFSQKLKSARIYIMHNVRKYVRVHINDKID